MTYEYDCKACGEKFEEFFTYITAGETFVESHPCPICANEFAERVVSRTLDPMFYGNPAGYDRPSPTKRHSTKLSHSQGNKNSVA